MSRVALALKYRPTRFEDLTEQESIKKILSTQIKTNTIKNGYLFTGPAGCGKTTSARIFANMINNNKGTPIELDAASNNSVDDIRAICEQAQSRSLDSEYKVFILDEVHVLSNQAWQAMLKTLEEPPVKSIFILCTTNPEKIPQTILSRVQRYNFQKIGFNGIVNRLKTIIECENMDAVGDTNERPDNWIDYEESAVNMIAKLSNGGMRDAITLMDKCLSYSLNLTEENVVNALGVADYRTMFVLLDLTFSDNKSFIIEEIEDIYNSGIDLKQFIKTFMEFLIDIRKYQLTNSFEYVKIPTTYEDVLQNSYSGVTDLLSMVMQLNNELKWEKDPKYLVEAYFMLFEEN